MRVLALDSTTRAGSVAIVDDDAVVDERAGDATRSHAERLPAEILALADANHTAIPSVDLFAVASGPGSFTGLRILPSPSLAGAIGRLAVGCARKGAAGSPSSIHPLYVRRPDAEVARERR